MTNEDTLLSSFIMVSLMFFMDILTEIRNRKSPLVFSDENVEKEKIEALIEVARWAPSCF